MAGDERAPADTAHWIMGRLISRRDGTFVRVGDALGAQGLHVVTAAEKARLDALSWTMTTGQTFTHCTLAERAVLDEAYALSDAVLHAPITHAEKLYPLCDAIQRWRREAEAAK